MFEIGLPVMEHSAASDSFKFATICDSGVTTDFKMWTSYLNIDFVFFKIVKNYASVTFNFIDNEDLIFIFKQKIFLCHLGSVAKFYKVL